MATTTPLVLRFAYRPDLAPAAKERAAFLTIYASADVRSPALPYAQVETSDSSAETSGTVTLKMRTDALAEVPRDASVTVCAFVSCENTHGEPAIDQAGYARFYLEDLLENKHDEALLVVANANHYSKGKIALSIEKFGGKIVFAPRSDYDYRGADQIKRALRVVEAHAALAMLPYSSFRPQNGYESMKAIKAPFYKFNDIVLPGAAFCLVRPDESSSIDYYEGVLDIVLRRRYPRFTTIDEARRHLVDELNGATWIEVARVLGSMLCIFVNSCTYLLDAVWTGHRSGVRSYLSSPRLDAIESFDCDVRARNSGDCEDFANQICMEAREIQELPFKTAAMKRVQACRRQYECEMILLGVSGSALADSLHGHVAFGGHMAARLTPKHQFLESFERASTQRTVFIGDEFGAPIWAETLPVLALEGTGWLSVSCDNDKTSALHAYVSGGHEEAFDRLKYSVEMPCSQEHSFYRSIQSSILYDRLNLGYPAAEAAWLWKPPTSAASAPPASSIPYVDSLRNEAVVRWVMTEFLDDEIRGWLPHLLKHVSPVPPHTLPSRASRSLRSPLLDSLVRGTPGGAVKDSWTNIDFALRDFQATEERVAALRSAINAKPRVRRVEVFREAITGDLAGFLLRIWLEK